MNIGEAVEAMQEGAAVRREGWNGAGMFVKLQVPDANSKMSEPYVYLVHPDKEVVIPWLCSQADLLASDWRLVDDEEVEKAEGLGETDDPYEGSGL